MGKELFSAIRTRRAGSLKRKRAEEHTVYDAEDGGVRADAERESEDGNRGKARAFCEEAKGEANVLHQSEHGFP